SEVNLTGLETFFTERRPFFVEGGDLFRFALTNTGFAFGPEQLFYSRRVGRAPQGAVPDDARFSDAPDATTLLGAMKLSGKTAGGWSVGALSAVTDAEEARFVGPAGERASAPVEPLTGYTVGRVIKDLRRGRSAVGGVLTSVNRRLEGDALDFLRGSAYAGGVDWRHRFGRGDNVAFSGSLIGSLVRGDAAAIAETQRSSVHYFQRPDAAGRLGVDSARTSLAGLSSELRLVKQGGGSWRWGAVGHVVTPGFEVNDVGFGNRADYGSLTGWVGYVSFRPGRLARSWELWNNHWSGWGLGGERLANGANFFGRAQLRNYWETYVEAWHGRPSLSVTALRGGPALYVPGDAGVWARVIMDARRRVYPELMGSRMVTVGADGGGGSRLSLAPTLNVRPSSRSELSIQPAVTWLTDPAQYVATHDTLGVVHYVAGRLEQTTSSLTARVGYTFTPALSFQLYAQPFVSGGRYTTFREVRAASARRFADRFRTLAPEALARDGEHLAVDDDGDGARDFGFDDPSFNVRSLQSNAVLRWEYRPGSTLFVVWTQSRDGDGVDGVRGGPGAFHLGPDARRLFGARATNMLLVKVSYWMSP
ncbi:MAG TPA: DUF5916 domain-containing protein, partial [Gemmatimonadaceae bacterium]|nr:DUF5916 domain-containing protein [Gemmatimonadaceae bacterium]